MLSRAAHRLSESFEPSILVSSRTPLGSTAGSSQVPAKVQGRKPSMPSDGVVVDPTLERAEPGTHSCLRVPLLKVALVMLTLVKCLFLWPYGKVMNRLSSGSDSSESASSPTMPVQQASSPVPPLRDDAPAPEDRPTRAARTSPPRARRTLCTANCSRDQ